jgi:hypothetical protein
MSEAHVCKPSEPYCCCSINWLEPSWDCPIHGGAIINRCDCGRFVRQRFYGEPATSQVSDPERTEE